MDANDPSTESGMAFPNLDSVEQFRVETSNFSAEAGRDPLQVTMITKSGTNQFHGTLWEFLRNDKLDARRLSRRRPLPARRRSRAGRRHGSVRFGAAGIGRAHEEAVRPEGGYPAHRRRRYGQQS